MLDFPEVPRGFRRREKGLYVPSRSRSLLRGDLAPLIVNNMLFGEDQDIDEVIQKVMAIEETCDSIEEYPFETPPAEAIDGPINIGYAEETGDAAGIFPHEVHTAIVGASGKGKSVLNGRLIKQHVHANIPVLVIDMENEYRELLQDSSFNILGVDSLKWNPLEPPPGMSPGLWIQRFSSVFCDQLDLLIASKNFLMESLDNLYTLYEVYKGSQVYPSVYELADYLGQRLTHQKVKSSRNFQYCETVENRVKGFRTALPRVLDCSSGMPLHILTRGNLIVEISQVDHDYQALLVTLILTWLGCHRIANGLRNNAEYDLAVFIDEAQKIADRHLERRVYQGVPTISQIIAQIRKYNIKLFLSAQQPSLLATSIKANSFCKVALALGDGEDIEDMGSSMFLLQEQIYYSRLLETGQAIVKFAGRWPEPFIVRIPYDD